MNQIAEIREAERQELERFNANIALTAGDVERMNTQLTLMKSFIEKNLVKGKHFYSFKQTKDGKTQWSLNKAGAEKILAVFNCFADTKEIKERELGGGHFEVDVKIDVISRQSGMVVGSGIGSCNSKEKKYSYSAFNPLDIKNAVIKMAKKRAVVDATLYLGCVSEYFTQDWESKEDLPPGYESEEEKSEDYTEEIRLLREELGIKKEELKSKIDGNMHDIETQKKALEYLRYIKQRNNEKNMADTPAPEPTKTEPELRDDSGSVSSPLITMAQAWEIIGIMKSKGWNEDKCKSVLTDKYALLIERPKLMDTIKQLTEDQAIEFKIYLSEANNGV